MDESLILGIDPGTQITGYGLIKKTQQSTLTLLHYGIFKLSSSLSLTEKYKRLFKKTTLLLKDLEPSSMVIETQFLGKNPQSTIKLSMARGVIILAATLLDIPVFEYPPANAKIAVTGNGQASKDQVQGMVARLLSSIELKDYKYQDVTDALALAICHSSLPKFHSLNKSYRL